MRVTLERDGHVVRSEEVPASAFNQRGTEWRDLDVELWWPNGQGSRPLYTVTWFHRLRRSRAGPRLPAGRLPEHRVAPVRIRAPEADPWVCVVNDRPVFLQGVNIPPVLPNFADATEEQSLNGLPPTGTSA